MWSNNQFTLHLCCCCTKVSFSVLFLKFITLSLQHHEMPVPSASLKQWLLCNRAANEISQTKEYTLKHGKHKKTFLHKTLRIAALFIGGIAIGFGVGFVIGKSSSLRFMPTYQPPTCFSRYSWQRYSSFYLSSYTSSSTKQATCLLPWRAAGSFCRL